MSANLKKTIRLKDLNYGDIVQNLSHVCFGSYHLPNNDDSCTTVNNETSFIYWKRRMATRYPNALISFDPNAMWSRRILLEDSQFNYDKEIFMCCKASVLAEGGSV